MTPSTLQTIPKEATKFSFPRSVFKWPDGTPIPDDYCVLVLTSHDSEELDLSKIIAIIILPEIYPKNWTYLLGLKSILGQNFPALKRIAICDIFINKESLNFIIKYDLDLFDIDDCRFLGHFPGEEESFTEAQFHTKILYINCDRFFSIADFVLCAGL